MMTVAHQMQPHLYSLLLKNYLCLYMLKQEAAGMRLSVWLENLRAEDLQYYANKDSNCSVKVSPPPFLKTKYCS